MKSIIINIGKFILLLFLLLISNTIVYIISDSLSLAGRILIFTPIFIIMVVLFFINKETKIFDLKNFDINKHTILTILSQNINQQYISQKEFTEIHKYIPPSLRQRTIESLNKELDLLQKSKTNNLLSTEEFENKANIINNNKNKIQRTLTNLIKLVNDSETLKDNTKRLRELYEKNLISNEEYTNKLNSYNSDYNFSRTKIIQEIIDNLKEPN